MNLGQQITLQNKRSLSIGLSKGERSEVWKEARVGKESADNELRAQRCEFFQIAGPASLHPPYWKRVSCFTGPIVLIRPTRLSSSSPLEAEGEAADARMDLTEFIG